MPDSSAEQRLLAAIMFTDMVGFSAVSHRNEALAVELLEEQQRIVRAAVAAHGGREIKTEGDGFMLAFPSALEAVVCAIEIQMTLAERNASQPPERQVRLRIGAHVGDVLARGTDLIGDGVNVAARIEPLAEPGGICVTSAVVEQVRSKAAAQIVSMGQPKLKNIDTPIEVFRVLLPGQRPERWRRAHPLFLRERAPFAVGAIALALAAFAGFLFRQPDEGPARRPAGPVDLRTIRSLAVLPLRGAAEPAQDAFLAGMTEALTTDLSHLGSLRVVSYQSARVAYGKGDRPVREMCRGLGVDSALTGTVQRLGDRCQINAQLVHGPSERIVWAEKFDSRAGDLLDAQNAIALAVARHIQLRLTGEEQSRLNVRRPADPQALSDYYLGQAALSRGTEASLRQSIDLFDQALARAPDLALAWAGKASAYAARSSLYLPPAQAMSRAEKAARRALELDPNLAEAHSALGYLLGFYHYNRDEAEAELNEAIRLTPSFAAAHMNLGLVLLSERRFDEALKCLRKALELEPTSVTTSVNIEWALLLSGRDDEAVRQAGRTLQMEPRSPLSYSQRGMAYLQLGKQQQALADLKKATEIERNSVTMTFYAYGLASAAQKPAAGAVLARFLRENANRYVCAYEVATAYEAMGNRRLALQWMDRGYREKCDCLLWGGVEPWIEPLRRDPQFKAVLARAGLME